jgi:hypothetical protein
MLYYLLKTSRLWEVSTGECKMDFRGHDHVVECAIFVPVIAYPFVRELIGVDKDVCLYFLTILLIYSLILFNISFFLMYTTAKSNI